MKKLLPLILGLGLMSFATAREPVPVGDWARITLPESYEVNTPFPVKVEMLKLEAPANLSLSANWKKKNGQFGGFLQFLKTVEVSKPGSHEWMLTLRKNKPDLQSAVITVYLSPDGSWENRIATGTADLPKAREKSGPETLGELSEKTPAAEPFSSETAPRIPSLEEGGFAENPGFEDTFDPGWPKQKEFWEVATWKQNGTRMSPERANVNEDGELVLTVKADKPYRGGSLQSNREFGYGRWVARVKASSVPGVLNTIFTKDWDNLETSTPNNDGEKGEIDIELLSHTFGPGRGEAHLAVHNDGRVWHVDIPLDFNPSDAFNEWGFDILPDRTVWHVNGRVLLEWMYTEENIITPDYEFFFNAWTMEKWIQGPPESDADYHIDWVRFYPLKAADPAPDGKE